jgi:hypothetical protein
MLAEDVAVGMELEAVESAEPGTRWLRAVVRRRLEGRVPVFEVRLYRPDDWLGFDAVRRADELRPAGRAVGAADPPLAGAARRTDDNLKRVFGD